MEDKLKNFADKIKSAKSCYGAGGMQRRKNPNRWRKDLAEFFFEIGDYDIKLLAWPREAEIDKEKTLANLKLLFEEINKIFSVIDKAVKETHADIALVEVGGTVGEYQNILFLEAIRILKINSYICEYQLI